MIIFDETYLLKLLQNEISIEQLEIGSIRLGAYYTVIDIFEITDIYVQDHIQGEMSDLTIKERLLKLEKYDGFIHLAGGLSCSIKNKIIEGFRLTNKYIQPVSELKREDIIKFYGKPDYELVDDMMHGGFDYAIDNYILVYNEKKINFYLDPNKAYLKEISTLELDLKYYSKR